MCCLSSTLFTGFAVITDFGLDNLLTDKRESVEYLVAGSSGDE